MSERYRAICLCGWSTDWDRQHAVASERNDHCDETGHERSRTLVVGEVTP